MNGFVLSAGAECLLGPWQGLTEDKGRGVEGGHDSGHDLGFVLVRQQSKPSSSTCLSDVVSNCKNQKSVKSAGYLSLKVTERLFLKRSLTDLKICRTSRNRLRVVERPNTDVG